MHMPFPYERRAWRINDYCQAYGVSRSTVYALAAAGKLRIDKIANRSVITVEEAERAVTASRKKSEVEG